LHRQNKKKNGIKEINMLNVERFEKISYYKDVIENPEYLINLIEKSDKDLNDSTSIPAWKEWIASGEQEYVFGYQKRFKNSVENDTNQDIQSINYILKKAIIDSSEDYSRHYSVNIGSLMPLSISKYSTGKSMGPHVDDYNNGDDPNISVVLYLNDDYEGGEINFPNQDITIKPEAGSIVIFPSVEPYYHQSLPVISGVKYMSPGFWRKTNKVV
jgi:predicted 2-oxoglutarate/Fe(II)-dependent dioxygenase YbiX